MFGDPAVCLFAGIVVPFYFEESPLLFTKHCDNLFDGEDLVGGVGVVVEGTGCTYLTWS